MRGFQPQHFADGGLVQGVKRLFGMDEERNARIAAYRAERAQEKAQQAAQAQQAQKPAPDKAISDYSGMSAAQRREKAAGLADGGMVRGPGTGTSDDVPDEVPEGTYIMPADSTQALGPDRLAAMGARGFGPGGKQTGKKVPVNLSNGEFKMPPEQVHAIGVQALDQAKNATHQPVRGFAPKARPEEPRQFFADGGGVRPYRATGVDDEFMQSMAQSQNARRQQANATASEAAAQSQADSDAQRLQNGYFPNNSPDAGKNIYAGVGPANGFGSSGKLATGAADVIGAQPPVAKFQPIPVRTPAAAPVKAQATAEPPAAQPVPAAQAAEPQAAFGVFPQMGRNGAGAKAPLPAPAPVAQIPATQVEGWRTKAVMDGAAQDAQAAWDRGGAEGVAGAAGAVARGAITAIPTAVGEFAYNTVAPLGGLAKGFWNGLTGGESAPPKESPATAAPAAAPAAPSPKTDAQRGGGNVPAIDTAAATSPQAPAAAPGPGEVTRVGNSYSGTNVSGNISINGQAPRNGGQVSAQNMAAADALSARSQQESMARVTAQPAVGFQPAGVTAPVARHSGNDWQARNELRNAQVSASSITQSDKWGKGGDRTATAQYLALQGADAAARGQQPAMDQAAMRENAGIQREGMQQFGATDRAARGFAVDQQRIGIEGRRVDSETEARGFQVRQGQRQEKLYERYDAAKTPEERAAVSQQIRELQGKEAPPSYKSHVLPNIKNADGSTTMGGVYQENLRTGGGQWVQPQGQGGAAQPLDQNQQAIAIRDNQNLSREQKVQALRKLGYQG